MSAVVILMSQPGDLAVVRPAYDYLLNLTIDTQLAVASAHTSPALVQELVGEAEDDGARIFICADSGSAHLAGTVAAQTTRPVIGLPLSSGPLAGVDALYSTVNMPDGIPVATVAIGGALNAAVLAAQILAVSDEGIAEKLMDAREALSNQAIAQNDALQTQLTPASTGDIEKEAGKESEDALLYSEEDDAEDIEDGDQEDSDKE